ncbi:MAG TPA: hypothetical protein PK644_02805, partial [bacterium]|nr:hypothetical protein [bacterium]
MSFRSLPEFVRLSRMLSAGLFFLTGIVASRVSAASFPLRDMAFSDSLDLSSTWFFLEDPKDEGAEAGWYQNSWNRSSWRPVAVPGVWGKRPGQVTYPIYTGLGWY